MVCAGTDPEHGGLLGALVGLAKIHQHSFHFVGDVLLAPGRPWNGGLVLSYKRLPMRTLVTLASSYMAYSLLQIPFFNKVR